MIEADKNELKLMEDALIRDHKRKEKLAELYVENYELIEEAREYMGEQIYLTLKKALKGLERARFFKSL